MIIAVRGMAEGVTVLESNEDARRLPVSEDGLTFAGPVGVRARITRMGEEVLVDARLTAPMELECVRCLKRFPKDIPAGFQSFYVPKKQRLENHRGKGGGPHLAEDQKVRFYENDTIDLGEDIRESIIMALPMRALCDEACRGLCPKCGKNLNDGPCACTDTDDGYHPFRDLLKSK